MIEFFLLGLMQGLLEWLPVSSSGQVFLAMTNILGINPLLAFEYSFFLHLSTFISPIIFFFNYLKRYFFIGSKLFWALLITTISSLLVAVPIYFVFIDFIEGYNLEYINVFLGVFLIFTGFTLLKSKHENRKKFLDELIASKKVFIIAGLFQGLSVLPGISRSAITISVLSLLGFKPDSAVRFSFLMSVPVTLIAGLYGALEIFRNNVTVSASHALVSFFSAIIFGLIGIYIMYSISRKISKNIGLFLIFLGSLIIVIEGISFFR